MYPKRVRTLLRVPTTNLPKSTVWFSWMLSKLTSHTFPWHDSVTLYFLPKLPSALDLTVSLAFMCSNVDISSSAHVDHKNCLANEYTTCENKIRSQFISQFYPLLSLYLPIKKIFRTLITSGFLRYHLKLWKEVFVFYIRELSWKC